MNAHADAQTIASAIRRVESVLQQRPAAGRHPDSPVTARWQGGMRIVARHSSGAEFATEMPKELGGRGDAPTPGWYLRTALASCVATCIAMAAAAAGVTLQTLEVEATSESDLRGLLGMKDGEGTAVPAGPDHVTLRVRIAADGATAGQLEDIVRNANASSPVTSALQFAVPVALQVEVVA